MSLEDIPESDAAVSYYVISDCRSATEKNVLPVKIYCLQVVTHSTLLTLLHKRTKNCLILLIEVVSQNLVNFVMWLLLLQLFVFLL